LPQEPSNIEADGLLRQTGEQRHEVTHWRAERLSESQRNESIDEVVRVCFVLCVVCFLLYFIFERNVWWQVIVDAANRKMKPVAVNARTTLILRNIPSDAAETEVRALITGDKWPKIVSLRSDVGDNWFVSFETEEHTKTALAMAKDKKFKDKSISCAIKSENLLKGLQPGAPSPPQGGPINGTYPGMYGGYVAANGGYGWNGGYAPDGGFGRGARAGGTRGGRAGPGVVAPPANGVAVAEDGTARNGSKRSKAKPREGRDGSGASPSTEKKVEQAPINLNDFPSLAGSAPPPTGYRFVFHTFSSYCVAVYT